MQESSYSSNIVGKVRWSERIPIAHSAESVSKFLEHIPSVPLPRRVDNDYLRSCGFNSTNDHELRGIARRLRLLDTDDRPTWLWRRLRVAAPRDRAALLRSKIMVAYLPLYKRLPDAHLRSDQEIHHTLDDMLKTTSSKTRALRTFRRLCDHGGLGRPEPTPATLTNLEALPEPRSSQRQVPDRFPTIIVQLSPLASQHDYEALFNAVRVVFS